MKRWKNGSHKEEHLLESLNLYQKKKKNEMKKIRSEDVQFLISNPNPEQNFYIIRLL